MTANTAHPAVASFQPCNDDIKVWRYMDVIRLVAFMDKRALSFTRADRLDDPFEGAVGIRRRMLLQITGDLEAKSVLMIEKPTPATPGREEWVSVQQAFRDALGAYTPTPRQSTFISCWHSGENESMGMWKQYGSTSGSVVVQSTYKKLLGVLPPEICMGMVQYRDYSSSQDQDDLSPFFHKRHVFEYEKEVRAVWRCPMDDISRHAYLLEVDVGQLVETIRTRPGTPEWELEAIASLIKKYDLGIKVLRSEVDAVPAYR